MQLMNQTKLMKKMMKIWKNNQRIALIITAAGSSTRFGKNIKKEYLPIVENDLSKGTVLGRSLETFLETGYFSTIVITIPENQQREAEKALSYLPLGKSLLNKEIPSINFSFCTGGNTRQSSVFEGLNANWNIVEAEKLADLKVWPVLRDFASGILPQLKVFVGQYLNPETAECVHV